MSSGGGSSGGGGSQTSKTTTSAPGWEVPYGKLGLGELVNMLFPGIQLPNIGALGLSGAPGSYPTLGSMPQNLNQQVAGFSPAQNQALQAGQDVFGSAQNLANQGAATVGNYASGGMLGPNPYLNSYYNQAATQLGNQYKYSTAPSLMAEYQQAGAFNSPGFNDAMGQAQYGLGQGLGTLGANIYEPAYQFESGQALNAAQSAPQAAAGQFTPGQYLYGLGSAQQQQQQNQYNTDYTNALAQFNYPYQLLNMLGGGLGLFGQGAGRSWTTSPSMAGGGGGFGLL